MTFGGFATCGSKGHLIGPRVAQRTAQEVLCMPVLAFRRPFPLSQSVSAAPPVRVPGRTAAVDESMALLVRKIALKLLRRLPPHVQFDDLHSAGLVALVEASRRYDGARGISFH